MFLVKNVPEIDDDIKFALSYYSSITEKLADQFLERLAEINTLLQSNPFFEVKYGEVRTLMLKQFPYIVHFIVNEERKEVIVLAIAYAKENPIDYSKRKI